MSESQRTQAISSASLAWRVLRMYDMPFLSMLAISDYFLKSLQAKYNKALLPLFSSHHIQMA